jgi:hypothetical protein
MRKPLHFRALQFECAAARCVIGRGEQQDFARARKDARIRWRTQAAVEHDAQRLARAARAYIQARIIGEHCSDPGQYGGAARAPLLHIGARRFARDPAARPVRKRRAPIKTHRKLDPYPRPMAPQATQEAHIELLRLRRQKARFHFNSGLAQPQRAASAHARVRILDRKYHARDARVHECVGARRRAPEMTAGLKRDIGARTRRCSACRGKRSDFGMRLARALVPAFADNAAVACDHAAHARIGLRRRKTPRGELQRPRHREAIEALNSARTACLLALVRRRRLRRQ